MIDDTMEKFRAKLKDNKFASLALSLFLILQLTIVYVKWGKPLIWDSNVYVGMGKVIFSVGQFGLWESFRPLMLPFISGFSWFLGIPMTNFPRLIAVLLSLTGLIIFYKFIADISGKKKAITSLAILISFSLFIKYSNYFLTGIPASFLVLSSLYAVHKEKFLIAGILSSMAFLTRFPAALIGPSVIIYLAVLAVRSGEYRNFLEKSTKYGAGVLVLAVPFLISNQIFYGDFLHPLISGAIIPTGNPDKYILGLWFLVEAVTQSNYLMAFSIIAAPVGAYLSIRKDFERTLLLLIPLVVFYLFFSLYPHKELRFALIFLPFLAYFSSEAIHRIEVPERLGRRNIMKIVGAILVLFMLAGTMQVIVANTWENTDRREFLENTRNLEGTVVSNSPEIVPYSDFRYIPVRPENLASDQGDRISINSCTSEKDTGFCKTTQDEIDYVVINGCAWYCTPAIDSCQNKIDYFSQQLEKDFERQFNMTGGRCDYLIYRGEEQ